MTGDTKRHLASHIASALCHCVTISSHALEWALEMYPQAKLKIQRSRRLALEYMTRLHAKYKRMSIRKQFNGTVNYRDESSIFLSNEKLRMMYFHRWLAQVSASHRSRKERERLRKYAHDEMELWLKIVRRRDDRKGSSVLVKDWCAESPPSPKGDDSARMRTVPANCAKCYSSGARFFSKKGKVDR